MIYLSGHIYFYQPFLPPDRMSGPMNTLLVTCKRVLFHYICVKMYILKKVTGNIIKNTSRIFNYAGVYLSYTDKINDN